MISGTSGSNTKSRSETWPNTGSVVSRTVTVWIAVVVTPEESVAVQVTVVLPTGNDTGASFTTAMLVSVSCVAVAVPMSTGVNVPVASTRTSAGAVILREEYTTVMRCVAWAELEWSSVAIQVIVVVPIGKEPGASLVMAGSGSTRSTAVAVP